MAVTANNMQEALARSTLSSEVSHAEIPDHTSLYRPQSRQKQQQKADEAKVWAEAAERLSHVEEQLRSKRESCAALELENLRAVTYKVGCTRVLHLIICSLSNTPPAQA